MTAQEWYEQGNAFRKESKWHEAINCYIQAIALDPDSPAVEAKRMLGSLCIIACPQKVIALASKVRDLHGCPYVEAVGEEPALAVPLVASYAPTDVSPCIVKRVEE